MRYPNPTVFIAIAASIPAGALAQSITVPSVAATAEDGTLELASSHFNAVSIADHTTGDAVTLTATHGTITLASTGGLILQSGTGTNDMSVIFRGAQADVNAALDGLLFEPNPGFAGIADLQVEVDGTTATLEVAVNASLDGESTRTAILDGLTTIHSAVQPGRMVTYGPEAYAVSYFADGPSTGPLIGAASWGAGRVLAVPDAQILNMATYGDDSRVLYTNGISWLARSASSDVSIVTIHADIAGWLTAQGYTDVTVASLASLAADLPGADVFVAAWLGSNVGDDALGAVRDYVTDGGGLFLAEYGVGYEWWWGGPISRAPGNLLLREAGIGFTAGHSWDTELIDASTRASGKVDAELLLDILLIGSAGRPPATLDEAASMLSRIYDALPDGDPLALELDAAFLSAVDAITPTPDTPVPDAFDQAMLLRETAILEAQSVDEVVAHRSAEGCFGVVDAAAPRISRTVAVDTSITRWHGTGLYAAPGEIVTVTVPAETRGAGYRVRISGHVDDIARRDSWDRMPRVARAFDLDAAEVRIASPFGGAVYIDVGANPSTDPFEVTVDGAVEAPRFILGETTNDAWRSIRDLPGPQAEIESEHCILSVPSWMVDSIDDIEIVADHWNTVVELQDGVAGHGDRRRMAERINIDVQISVGLLHAGYPTQGPDWASRAITELDTLMQTGSWGWYHELGHEAQRRPDKSWGWNNPYTFDGGVEATVNIFTAYAYDQLGQPSRGGWSWTGPKAAVMQRALDAIQGGGTFASVGVGDKLAMYLQLRDGWGWDRWTEFFGLYNDADTQPDGEQAERDLFLQRWADITGHDVSRLLVNEWGLGASAGVVDGLQDLPDWLPAVGGVDGRYRVRPGDSIAWDLEGEALSHDGVATVEVGEADVGTLRRDGGVWRWDAPGIDWVGVATFEYGVTSSTGHTSTHTVEVESTWAGVWTERWLGVSGGDVADLTDWGAYPDDPDETEHADSFRGPVDYADDYGTRMSAYVRVPETGDYTFWIASDDAGELWISEDGDPTSGSRMARVLAWTGDQVWDAEPGQQSSPLTLAEGDILYVEALHKQGGGGDHVTVAWEGPGVEFQVLGPPYVGLSPDAFIEPPTGDDDDDDATDDDDILGGEGCDGCESSVVGGEAAMMLVLLPLAARRRRASRPGRPATR